MIALLPVLALALPIDTSDALDPVWTRPEPVFALARPALSDDFPPMEYTFAELNYLRTDSDAGGKTLDGAELIGSFELPLNFFAQARVSHQENGPNLDSYSIGAGYHFPLTARFDAFGILSYAHEELSSSPANFNKDGVIGELGLRFLPTKKIELNASAKWVDVEQSDSGATFGARFYLMNHFSIGGRYEAVGADNSVALGLRLEL